MVASSGRALPFAPRQSGTAAITIDLAAIAAAADEHLSTATDTQKETRRRCVRAIGLRTWTTSAMLGIMPRHACSARCGARRRSGLGGLGRRRACQSGRLSPRHCVLDTRRHAAGRAHACGYVDNARALSTYPQAQQPTISINLITSESQGSDPARHIQANVSPGSRHTSPASLRHLCADSDSHSHKSMQSSRTQNLPHKT